MTDKKDFGKKFEYDPLWKGPIDIERKRTDSKFLIAFLVTMLVWLATSIYAIKIGKIMAFSDDTNPYQAEIFNAENVHSAINITVCFTILTAFFSVIFIILLRWYAKVIVYTSIITMCVLLLGFIIFMCSIYNQNLQNGGSLIVSIVVLSVLLLILVVCTIIFRRKIHIACEIIRESSKAVMFFPSVLVFPFLPFILYSILVNYATFVGVNIFSLVDARGNMPMHAYFLLGVCLFGFCWLGNFITGFADMTLSGTFSTWYWTTHKAYVPRYTIFRSMRTTARYHLGTIAFGSLVIAICQMINYLLSSIRDKLQNRSDAFTCCCFGWYQYFFQNLENLVKFMSRGAYVMSAMHGTNFIQSTKDAFNLYMRNILKVLVSTTVTDAVLGLGVLLSMGLSTLCAWGYISTQHSLNSNLLIVALSSMIFFSALVSAAFFMVLKSAIDTIFLCVLEDYERNDGSEERPYFMTNKIQSLLFKEQSESV